MSEAIAAGSSGVNPNILLLVGLAITGGSLGAKLFKRIHIPQVIGYIVVGIIAGRSGLALIDEHTLATLEPFNFIALGLIGFQIGGELKISMFRKHGRQFAIILLSETVGAFLLVGGLTFAVQLLCGADPRQAAALSLVLGAIASATAPAATVSVLSEYKARGLLTTTVLAIVALDDGVAVALFALASSLAGAILGNGVAVSDVLLVPLRELGFAAALGGVTGIALALLIRKAVAKQGELIIAIGAVILAIGVSFLIGADPIMTAMVLGFTFTNVAPTRSAEAFALVRKFAAPIFVLFFVMAGSRLTLGNLQGWMWAVAGAYVVGRIVGKMAGASLGATLSGSAQALRRYLGPCLFSQAGVAVGLSILARMRIGEGLGEVVVAVIAATVFLFEVVGPATVKYGIVRAGEAWRGVTEEDLIRSHRVGDVMRSDPPSFREETPLPEILRSFGRHNVDAFPVVSDRGELKGVITIQEIRDSLAAGGLARWLMATDLMGPAHLNVDPDLPLFEALENMRKKGVESVPVVYREDEARLAGMLRQRDVGRAIMAELSRRHAPQERPEEPPS